jgi:hypothetical protein
VSPKLWLAAGFSILVLLPCVWHRRIEAGDLGSHLYNAWLAQLIGRGQAPGLYIVPQWNNILADLAFTWLGRVLGLVAAEKIVVGLAVLIFFWGAFAFITVVARREPWFLVPGLAMVAYGYTFQMGFINYYLSLGLAFWVIALLCRGRTGDWILSGTVCSLDGLDVVSGNGRLHSVGAANDSPPLDIADRRATGHSRDAFMHPAYLPNLRSGGMAGL